MADLETRVAVLETRLDSVITALTTVQGKAERVSDLMTDLATQLAVMSATIKRNGNGSAPWWSSKPAIVGAGATGVGIGAAGAWQVVGKIIDLIMR